jgi:hypothetical protein
MIVVRGLMRKICFDVDEFCRGLESRGIPQPMAQQLAMVWCLRAAGCTHGEAWALVGGLFLEAETP